MWPRPILIFSTIILCGADSQKRLTADSTEEQQTMEDFWKRAKSFAEEAAKQSQSLTNSAKISDLVSETAKKSKEFAAEASKKADQIKIAALKQAEQIKFSEIIPPQLSLSSPLSVANSISTSSTSISQSELEKFGVTDDLRSFVKGLTSSTFQNFPLKPDDAEASDVPTTASNVRKDLNEFQEKHATLVLTTVKEISKLRYELCPRAMKERHFWKIYFTLVNTYVSPFEKRYLEEIQLRAAADQKMGDKVVQTGVVGGTSMAEATEKNVTSKSSNSSSTEQDLDTFLLGGHEDGDEGPDDGEDSFGDDFDKIGNSDVEDEKHTMKASVATA